MHEHRLADAQRYRTMCSSELRGTFLIDDLFRKGEATLHHVPDCDRVIVGGVVPADQAIDLPVPEALRATSFCDRRELGILNIGGDGKVEVDGNSYTLKSRDALYVGRGAKTVRFSGSLAKFYLLSYPAHASHPTTHIPQSKANRLDLGSEAESNKRTIFQYIYEGGAKSCQLVMGLTELATGSVWNTMPPHTHTRRSEVYMYFDLAPDHRVAHFMGEPADTRVLWIADGQVALSPNWSVHCGAGTSRYCFIWGMGGENQRFDDMDKAAIASLR
jgi:4-deoxy-L-threo-5-hexosulose-uronate ketol-isomerase